MNERNREKKIIAHQTALILISLYFALLESIIPKPFPWLRFGLANIATLIGMEYLGVKKGVEIAIIRIIIASFFIGTLFTPSFFISLFSGGLSVIIVGLLFRFRSKLSLTSISCAGGFFHNIGQMIMVYFLFFRNINIFEKGILIFIGLFLLTGAVLGGVVGGFAEKYRLKSI